MSERSTRKSNKNTLRRTAEAVALAATTALALSGCTSPSDAPNGPRIENVEPSDPTGSQGAEEAPIPGSMELTDAQVEHVHKSMRTNALNAYLEVKEASGEGQDLYSGTYGRLMVL